MKPPRFSLRGLLLLTAIVAALGYWRDRPRQIANQFTAALEAKDRAALGRLVADFSRYDRMFSLLGNAATDTSAAREDQRFSDWVKGECRVLFVIDGPGNLHNYRGTGVASATNVKLQSAAVSGGLLIHVK
jgi:hypothetical protein